MDWHKKPMLRWVFPVPFLILGLIGFALYSGAEGLVGLSRSWTHDLFQWIQPRQGKPATPRVVIADIDAQSRRDGEHWPWPRTRYVQIIEQLSEAGAAVIVLDTVFARSDQTSPDQMLETWWSTPGVQQAMGAISQLPDHDALFAGAIKKAKVVTGFEFTATKTDTKPLIKANFALPRKPDRLGLPGHQGVTPTIRPLSSVSAGNGAVNTSTSVDGVTRTLPLLHHYNGRVYPHQVLEAIRLAQNVSKYEVIEITRQGERKISAIQVGTKTIPVTENGELRLYSRQNAPIQRVPISDVLNGTLGGTDLSGAIVFVSASSDDSATTLTTTQRQDLSSTIVKAEALKQIIDGQYLSRPGWAQAAETAAFVVFGLLIVGLAYWVSPLWATIVFALGTAAFGYAGWYLFSRDFILLDAGTPVIGLTLIGLATFMVTRLRAHVTENYVRHAYGHYLSPSAVTTLSEDTSNLTVTGEKRDATIMVCGIRDLEKIEKQYANHPEALGRLINEFLGEMTAHVHATQGTINRYVGDYFIAVWNAPLDDKDHCTHAIECALKMLESLDSLNRKLEASTKKLGVSFSQVAMGIGVSTGECFAGLMGSRLHDEYSVIGEAVRNAHDLFLSSESYGPAVIVDETTYMAVHHAYALLEVDFKEEPKRSLPTRVFALMGNSVMKASPKFRALEKAHQAFFTAIQIRDWDSALQVIEDAKQLSGAMPTLYDLYAKRIYSYMDAPPDEKWIGAHPE